MLFALFFWSTRDHGALVIKSTFVYDEEHLRVVYIINSILSNYYVLYCFCFFLFLVVVVCTTIFLFVKVSFTWCPCVAINVVVSVQYNGGLLPDIILLTQCYYHRGTLLNAMKRFCLCSLLSHQTKRFDIFPPVWDAQKVQMCSYKE